MKKELEKRLEIKELLPYLLDLCSFEGDIYEVADKIRNIPETYLEIYQYYGGIQERIGSFHRFSINTSTDYDGSVEINIYGWRWETDEEFNKRKQENISRKKTAKLAAKTRESNKAKKELEEYNRLKLKFRK